MSPTVLHRFAAFSPDRAYRYTLVRQWNVSLPKVVFIGLNPSIADERQDDQTVKKCIGFARRWGCGSLTMVNLFALVATDPNQMMSHSSPIGPDNDATIRYATRRVKFVVAAWGADGLFQNRAVDVLKMLQGKIWCLGKTKAGHPRHPSRLGYATTLEKFKI